MPKIQAYSSVSVVDLTDVGVINFYLTSNLPNSVIYDPNTNNGSGTYSPNWATTNLQITPVISYNGTNINRTDTHLVISYQRKEGAGNATNLTTGEAVSQGVLTVSANKIAGVTSGQLTYICDVTYTDPDTGVPISAQASLSYSLLPMPSELKYAGIICENNSFLYNTNGTLVSPSTITLTPDLTNCSLSEWQYKNSNGDFVAFPNTAVISDVGALTISHNEPNIWLNNDKMAIIKLITNDSSIYDYVQIIKIRDGAPGNSTIAAVLTNENHVVPVDSDGTPKGSTADEWKTAAATEIHIYQGGNEITDQWTISVTPGSGLTGNYNSSTHIYTPSTLTVDSSYAEFNCTRTGYSPINKRYTISKQYSGADGADAVFYEVVPDVYAMNLAEDGVTYTPENGITFSAFKITGSTKSVYAGRFKIYESADGTDFGTAKYTSKSNESTKIYKPSINTSVAVKCVLYKAGGTTEQLDEQTVVVTRDGTSGQNGQPGADAISMGLGNYYDGIPCTSGGLAAAQRDLTIPFWAKKGITRVAVTASVATNELPNGVSVQTNNNGTASQDGRLVLRVQQGANFGDASLLTGSIPITLTAEGRDISFNYTWAKNNQAINGTNAVALQIFNPGTVEVNRDTTITTKMYSGTGVVTPARYEWAEWKNGNYVTMSGKNSSSITITEDMVTDYMWLKCSAWYPTYNNSDPSQNRYDAYCTVDDITDPIVAYTHATISQFKNTQGFGAIYTVCYRNGDPVDPIKSTTFSDTAPTTASNGDYYYHLTPGSNGEGTCTLKKYNGTQWVNATDTDEYNYAYYRINNKGESIDTNQPWKTGRCQYISAALINGRMQFICEVSESNTSSGS